MPNIAEKSKVFGGKGVVLSFTRAPDVYLYRELIPGTKKYRYKVIDGANTLEAAIDKSLDAYNALKRTDQLNTGDQLAIGQEYREWIQCIKNRELIPQDILFINTSTFRKQFQ